jgi:putative transposase
MEAMKSGAHTRYDLKYHIVFVPKYRRRVLGGPTRVAYVQWLIGQIAKEYDCTIVELAIRPDHVHLFIEAPPRFSPAQLVNALKSITAKEMFEKFPEIREKLWAGEFWAQGYYVGTVGDKVTTEAVRRYIKDQGSTRPELDDGRGELPP